MQLQNATKKSSGVHGKWYGDACGTAFALELVGERWSLLIVRELMFGGRRFTDLRAALPGISAKILTERLEGLERAGILQRRQLPPPAAVQLYELTPWGYEAEEAIKALGRWAARSPDHDPTLPLSIASLMMSLRTLFDSKKAEKLTVTAGISIGAEPFRIEIAEGRLSVQRGAAEAPDFTLCAPQAQPVAIAIYGKVPFEELIEAGLEFTGNRQAATRFIDAFHLPEKIGTSSSDVPPTS